jgi:8-oxo-dGTP diphosphatase
MTVPPGPSRDSARGRIRLGAYALCRRDDAILLCRAAATEQAAGRWALPGGGLDFGEAPESGVLRELEEETGLRGDVGAVLAVASHLWPQGFRGDGSPVQTVGILYAVTITGGELRNEVDESTDLAAWVAVEDLRAWPLIQMTAALLGRVGLLALGADIKT